MSSKVVDIAETSDAANMNENGLGEILRIDELLLNRGSSLPVTRYYQASCCLTRSLALFPLLYIVRTVFYRNFRGTRFLSQHDLRYR